MSRRSTGDPDFGSDSFLDVIANIVGILIILIVVAGLRVARTPVKDEAGNSGKTPPNPLAARPEKRESPPVSVPKIVHQNPRPKPPPLPVPLPEIPSADVRPAAEITAQVTALKTALTSLRDRFYRVQLEQIAVRKKQRVFAAQQAAVQWQHRQLAAEEAGMNQRLQQLEETARRNAARLSALQQQYDEARRQGPPVKQIRHKLTPVGREVRGKEIHFHVTSGRVSPVPLEKLLRLMKEDVLRRKEWLFKFPVHRGRVGPLDGFTMSYVVERRTSTALNELRTGFSKVQIVLTGWKILPTVQMRGETAEEALQPESRFLRALHFAPAGTTATFWVYPDSFTLFRRLQSRARQEGFRVAARPLPFGVPIAGSPRGTRSAGQ